MGNELTVTIMTNWNSSSEDLREPFIVNRLEIEKYIFLSQKVTAGSENYCKALWPGLYKRSMDAIILAPTETD